MDSPKIFLDLDSLSVFEKTDKKSSFHIRDTVVSDWFDVTVSSDISPALIQSALSTVRRFSEKSDRSDDLQLLLSPSGASGGGLASMFLEALGDSSYNLKSASVVLPHTLMFNPGQAVNTIMTLRHLADHVTSSICFDNTVLMESDFSNVNKSIVGCSLSLASCKIQDKFSQGNLFVKRSKSDNVMIQLESLFGRNRRPKFSSPPTVVFSGHPLIPKSLVNSFDSILGKEYSVTELESPIVGLGSLAIAYRDTTTLPQLVKSLIESTKICAVPSNHREWFSETVEQLCLEFL